MNTPDEPTQKLSEFFRKGSPTALKLESMAIKNIEALVNGFTPYQYDQFNKERGYERN
tara:strand:- start:284 stop:457 length:174 start_codon:yes stop_codon:yes gene_type:complete